MTTKIEKIFCLESVDLSVGEVDREKGVIRGAKVIEKGPLNDDRPLEVDDITVDQVVDFGNRPNKGVKVRLTHPQGDSMGLHLGRALNFRREGDVARADIQLSKSSFISPKGDIGGYVLTLAEEDPESMGMSVATILDREAMLEESSEDGIAPLRFRHLYAVDVVSTPAATRGGLFSESQKDEDMTISKPSPVDAEDKTAELAAEAPQTHANEPEQVQASVDTNLSVEALAVATGDHKEFVETFGSQGALWYLEGRSLSDCYKAELETVRADRDKLAEQLAELQASGTRSFEAAGEDEAAEPTVELSEADLKRHEQEVRELEARKRGIRPDVAKAASALANLGK